MKRNIFTALGLIFIALILSVSFISCSDVRALFDDELTFVSNGDGTCYLAHVQGYYGKNAVIPEVSPKGDKVVAIGNEAFAGSGIIGVTIPEGVAHIGSRAFAACEMLEEIRLPATLSRIGARAFEGCTALRILTVHEDCDVYFSVGNCLIVRESGILVAGCGGSIIPADGTVTAIADGAFYNCATLTEAVIPEGVNAIGNSAFYGCSALASVTLPESLQSIGTYAFNGCSAIEKITVPAGITVLNEGVFRNCSAMTVVVLPEGLDSIEKLAFAGCKKLKDPVLPVSLTYIGDLAFYGCESLIHMKFFKNVEYIGDGAFLFCDLLWGIKVDKENTVYRASGNCLIRRSDGVIILGTRGSTIPEDESVTAIADRAFYGAKHIDIVRIPANIKYVGNEAFYGCTYMVNAVICGENTVIGDKAFYRCRYLDNVYISSGVTYMGADVFDQCIRLTRILLEGASVPEGWDPAWNNGCGAELVFSQDIPAEN